MAKDRSAIEEPSAGRARAADWMAPLGAAASMVVIFVAMLAVPVQAAADRELSPAQTATWIVALFGIPAVVSLLLIWRYRQPLVFTGNVFVWIYFARLGGDIAWSDLVGASMLAGVIVTALGPLRLTRFLTRWLPSSIVSALLAGAVLGFFIDMFSALDRELVLVGVTLVAYLLARSAGRVWLPPMLPALVAGFAAAAIAGELHSVPGTRLLPSITLTWPTLSLTAIATVTPVVVLLMTLPSNVPAMVLLESHGYEPPKGVVGAVSGLSTIAGSVLGPSATSLSLPGVAICVAPEAGERRLRPHAAALASIGALVIAVLGGIAAHTATIVPRELLIARSASRSSASSPPRSARQPADRCSSGRSSPSPSPCLSCPSSASARSCGPSAAGSPSHSCSNASNSWNSRRPAAPDRLGLGAWSRSTRGAAGCVRDGRREAVRGGQREHLPG